MRADCMADLDGPPGSYWCTWCRALTADDPTALHLRIIYADGTTVGVCSLVSYVEINEYDADALVALGRALVAWHGEETHDFEGASAHHWRHLGAGGSVGLVIEDGPMPLRPSPTEQAGPDNSRE